MQGRQKHMRTKDVVQCITQPAPRTRICPKSLSLLVTCRRLQLQGIDEQPKLSSLVALDLVPSEH